MVNRDDSLSQMLSVSVVEELLDVWNAGSKGKNNLNFNLQD